MMGWFVCFAGGDRRIIISAGRLVSVTGGISPVGFMMVSYAVFVWSASVSATCTDGPLSVWWTSRQWGSAEGARQWPVVLVPTIAMSKGTEG